MRFDLGQFGVASASLRFLERDLRSVLAVVREVLSRPDWDGVAVFRNPLDGSNYEVNAGLVASGWVADEFEYFEGVLDSVQEVLETVSEVCES